MKGGKQQGRHNNGPLWKPSGNSEMTQRVSCRSVAFPHPQRELAPAGLDCRTCRDAYWLTHCRQGVELGGRGMNRSDNSQRRGMGHGDGGCVVDGWWKVTDFTWVWRMLFLLVMVIFLLLIRLYHTGRDLSLCNDITVSVNTETLFREPTDHSLNPDPKQ